MFVGVCTSAQPGFVHCDRGLSDVTGQLEVDADGVLAAVDPRLAELGYRLILPKSCTK